MKYLVSTLLASSIAAVACDININGLGKEPDTTGGTSEPCNPGDKQMAPDGCNECICTEEGWACTQAACADTDGEPACEVGQTEPAPDGCNECICTDDGWVCTDQICGDEGGEEPCTDGDTQVSSDGCSHCVCSEGQWQCSPPECAETDGNEPGTDALQVCGPETPYDPLFIDSASIEGDELRLDVTYSGGCAEHIIGACWEEAFLESFPVQAVVSVTHESNDDPCEALPSEQVVISLLPLKESYQTGYQTEHGTIMIVLQGTGDQQNGTLTYEF